MKLIKSIPIIFWVFSIWGCFVFPLKTVEPLSTTVVDSESGKPIAGAVVLRIVCGIHDFSCKNASIEKKFTNNKGMIYLGSKREWGPWFPAPGGLPVPNHQIAIWKEGYSAFIFLQYNNDIDQFAAHVKSNDIREAIREIPKERKYLSENIDPSTIFVNGKVELYKLK